MQGNHFLIMSSYWLRLGELGALAFNTLHARKRSCPRPRQPARDPPRRPRRAGADPGRHLPQPVPVLDDVEPAVRVRDLLQARSPADDRVVQGTGRAEQATSALG